MRLRDDERGQSVQIGAVLLFATLIIAFSSYQAFVVPQQNEEIEFNHNQQVHQEMQDLRNAIVSMPGGGSATATSVTLGTTYPSRAVAQNPGPASGSLRTAGTENELVNLSIRNATASGETGDVWDGSRRSYNTGGLVYDPSYNLYGEAPLSIYEHSVLYNEFRSGTIVKSDQSIVDGRTVSLVVLNGSFGETSAGATSVDVRPVSSSTETVIVEAADSDSPVTINFTSRLSATRWGELLSEEDNVRDVRQRPAAVPGPYHAIVVELEPGVAYRLQLTKVGIGNRVTDEDPDYLTDVDGDGSSVTRGDSQRVTLAVRDGLNNPVSDVTVNASVGPGKGSFAETTKSTDGDGEVTFTYQTSSSTSTGTHQLNFTTNDSAVLSTRPFQGGRPKNVTVDVTVNGGGGGGGTSTPYTLAWDAPDVVSTNDAGALSSCSADSCTWDVGADSDDQLDLRAALSETIEGLTVEFAVDDSNVGTVSPSSATTDSNGEVTTTLEAFANGTVGVYAASGGTSDKITIDVTNVTGSATNAAPSASFTYSPSNPAANEQVSFDASGSSDSDGSITEYQWDFGDGTTTTTTSETISHMYDRAGSYTVTLTVVDNDGATSTTTATVDVAGRLTYNGDATAVDDDNDGTPAGMRFSYKNRYDQDATVTSVTIDPADANVDAISDERNGVGPYQSEVYVGADTDDGYAEVNGGTTIPAGGVTLTMDDTATSSSTTNGTIYLYRFYTESGNSGNFKQIDMTGRDVTITVEYTLADGSSETSTFTVTG